MKKLFFESDLDRHVGAYIETQTRIEFIAELLGTAAEMMKEEATANEVLAQIVDEMDRILEEDLILNKESGKVLRANDLLKGVN